jgi:hypothetical protein
MYLPVHKQHAGLDRLNGDMTMMMSVQVSGLQHSAWIFATHILD